MKQLYIVIDDDDDVAKIRLDRCPIKEVVDTTAGIPDQPCRVLPPLEAYVQCGTQERRVVLGVNASEDLNVALRLALRKVERYISDAGLRMIETHKQVVDHPGNRQLGTKYAATTIKLMRVLEAAHLTVGSLYSKTVDYIFGKDLKEP